MIDPHVWGRGEANRGETMIALRARREATQVAREVEYPQLPGPPPMAEPVTFLPPADPLFPEWWDDGDIDYASRLTFVPPPDEYEPAPLWMKWLLPACVGVIACGGFLLVRWLQ